jgi:hypothetical protein
VPGKEGSAEKASNSTPSRLIAALSRLLSAVGDLDDSLWRESVCLGQCWPLGEIPGTFMHHRGIVRNQRKRPTLARINPHLSKTKDVEPSHTKKRGGQPARMRKCGLTFLSDGLLAAFGFMRNSLLSRNLFNAQL